MGAMQRPDTFKNILAIRFMRLGDVVLLLPALARLKASFPQAHVTLLTDDRCASIGHLCPFLDEVIGVDRLKMRDGSTVSAMKSMTALINRIRKKQFDLVLDLLSFRETNLLAWLSGAPYRLGMKRYGRAYLQFCFTLPPVDEDKNLHVSDMFQRIVSAVAPGASSLPVPEPLLRLPVESQEWVARSVPCRPFFTFYVGAPVAVRRWPAENFARVADFAVERLGVAVVVLAGEPESAIATRIRDISRHPERVSVFYDLSISRLSALIASSSLLVSNDTGPMHIGPAFGVPTLGLFSVGYPEHYHPLGEHSRYLRGNPIDQIFPDLVIRNVSEMWEGSVNPSDLSQKPSAR